MWLMVFNIGNPLELLTEVNVMVKFGGGKIAFDIGRCEAQGEPSKNEARENILMVKKLYHMASHPVDVRDLDTATIV